MDTTNEIPRDLLLQALDQSQDGITITDARQAGYPLIYVNKGFERLTGYNSAEIIGKSYRILQGNDTDQPELAIIRAAASRQEGCTVTLRNYRKDGSMFWNELSIAPVRDADGKLTHYIGVQQDATARVLLEQHMNQPHLDLKALNQQLNGAVSDSHHPALGDRQHFDERFAELRATAQRTHCELSVLMIDLDNFQQFNEAYGFSAGEECMRMVGECVAKSFARSTDCAAHYGKEDFAVVSLASSIDDLRMHAQKLCEQVRALSIPNSESSHGVVTISIGGVHRIPDRETGGVELLELAEQELFTAKRSGRNRVHIVS
ncbi:MAG: diguanylate cyclase [Nitrosomonadales bacterium]|nr:diguanylate cyclase [Nitrosomonadales bacterium]